MSEDGQKVHIFSYKISKSWGCNIHAVYKYNGTYQLCLNKIFKNNKKVKKTRNYFSKVFVPLTNYQQCMNVPVVLYSH